MAEQRGEKPCGSTESCVEKSCCMLICRVRLQIMLDLSDHVTDKTSAFVDGVLAGFWELEKKIE